MVANNANQVKETLALSSSDEPTVLESHEMVKADSATSVSSQLDREIKHHRKKDAFFFKANPTFALDHVTVTNRKTGRNILDDLSLSFHAGARMRCSWTRRIANSIRRCWPPWSAWYARTAAT